MIENLPNNCCMERFNQSKKEMIFGKINNKKLNKQIDRQLELNEEILYYESIPLPYCLCSTSTGTSSQRLKGAIGSSAGPRCDLWEKKKTKDERGHLRL